MSVPERPSPAAGARSEFPLRVAPAASVRAAALAGIAFFVLIVVNAQLRSGAPAAGDPGREILAFVADNHGRLQLAAVALAFAMPAALVWLSGLFQVLRRAQASGEAHAAVAALGAGILAAAATLTGALLEGAIAAGFADLEQDNAVVLWRMFLMSTGATLLGLALLIGSTAVVCARTRLFAGWLTPASVALVIVSLAGAFTIGYSSDAIQVVAGLAVLLDSVWILLVSILMWRDARVAVS